MTRPSFDNDQDKEPPLDPAAERLQRKLKRLLGVSSLIMVLGFIAVFAAIAYRVTRAPSRPNPDSFAATVALQPGEEVADMEVVDGRIVLLVRKGATSALLYLDPATGRQLARTDFVAR
ncbi:hypothetical protein H2509_08905 [Stappia sp. F7233]|uniref:Fimbrial protein n=1 Tax=Stappia albiluteola TaxID=2758565 RepID=A0A839AE61_9HYPH|nr:hypothetical protein [Stappia albiluteola]MBA5777244.1 hypothetical protein [Stappia albiluteola]